MAIIIVTDNSNDLESLYDFLIGEPALGSSISLSRSRPSQGSMGGAADAIAIAVGASGAATVLASALKEWVRTPRTSAKSSIIIRNETEVVVEIKTDGVPPKDLAEIIRAALTSERGDH